MAIVKSTGLNSRDTPGDKTFYILQGSIEHENYRLYTFKRFPGPINPYKLAKVGFFYLGYKDQVKCFSCLNVVDNWNAEDNAEDPRLHQPNCRMVKNIETDNIPLPRPFTNPNRVLETSAERKRALEFPCTQPKYPNMTDFQQRLQTFSSGWDHTKIKASPRELASCGLFYIGSGDKTQCFYCGGGLQNWAYEDDIWSEHTKWYPACEFVLRKKGVEFVRTIYEETGNIARPPIEVRSEHVHELWRSGFTMQPQPQNQSYQNNDIVIQSFLENSSVVNQVKALGFRHDDIKAVISRKFLEGSDISFTKEELIQELNTLQQSRTPAQTQQSQLRSFPSEAEDQPDPHVQRKLAEMKFEMICKKCLTNQVGVLVMPCGHFALCRQCAESAERCPICSHGIQQLINVYLP